jgi:hypothetical protein
VLDFCKRHPQYKAVERDQWPDYLHDANAVIALLEKEKRVEIVRSHAPGGDDWTIHIATKTCDLDGEYKEVSACEKSFCEAACRALLAAHGAAEGGGK